MFVRYYALLLGIALLLAGIGGFVAWVTPAADSDALHLSIDHNYGYLIGLFPVNIVHNLVHLSFGIYGLIAFHQWHTARRYCQIMAVILGIFTLMGLLSPLKTLGGLMPLYSHAIWLHGLEAAAAGYLGFVSPGEVKLRVEAALKKVL